MRLRPAAVLPALLVLLAVLTLPGVARAATPGVNIADVPTRERVDEALATGAKQIRIFTLWSDFENAHPGDIEAQHPDLLRTFDDAVDHINAAGAKPVLVVAGTPNWANANAGRWVPPINADDYGRFLGTLTARWGTKVAAYEVWNEEDEDTFWQPGPNVAAYTTLLKAAYAGGKAGNPQANIVMGPLTGNNYAFLEQVYANGGKGSFDGVAVHTDTACLVNAPDVFYRENGRLARFTFLGYREIRASMLAQGDDKAIWMSELGWSGTGAQPNSCGRGTFAHQKPDGVTEADQAKFLTHAYACLANDPYVVGADWFTLRDATGNTPDELNHYGLIRTNGSRKPAYAAFQAVAAANGGAAGACGDFVAPTIQVAKPFEGEQFEDRLDLKARAFDNAGGVGAARLTYSFDGGKKIRNFTEDLGVPAMLSPWFGSRQLAVGPHTVEVTALDKNGNTATVKVNVVKVAPGAIASTLTPQFKLGTKVSCTKRTCTFRGQLMRGAAAAQAGAAVPSIGGKVKIAWEWRNAKGSWRKLSGGLKPAGKPFAFTSTLRKGGLWRLQLTYVGQAPWKATVSKRILFRVAR